MINIHNFSEKMLEAFLANELNVTTRAIRLMKRDNPKRYEREMIGAIMLNSGMRLDNILYAVENVPSFFDKEKTLDKYPELEGVIRGFCETPRNSDEMFVETKRYEDEVRANLLYGFLSSYFEDFESEEGKIRFCFSSNYEGENVASRQLIVYLEDITMSDDDAMDGENVYIVPMSDDDGIPFKTDFLIEEIKDIFPSATEVVYPNYSHNISNEAHVIPVSKESDEVILSHVVHKGNDVAVCTDFHYDCGLHTYSLREAGGLKKGDILKDKTLSKWEIIDKELEFIDQVIDRVDIKDRRKIDILIEKISSCKNRVHDKELGAWIDAEISVLLMNLTVLIVDTINPGMMGVIEDSKSEMEGWFDEVDTKKNVSDFIDFEKEDESLYFKSFKGKSKPFVYSRLRAGIKSDETWLDRMFEFNDTHKKGIKGALEDSGRDA